MPVLSRIPTICSVDVRIIVLSCTSTSDVAYEPWDDTGVVRPLQFSTIAPWLVAGDRVRVDIRIGRVAEVDPPAAVVLHGVSRDLEPVADLDPDAVILVSDRAVVLDRGVVGVDVQPDAVAEVVVEDAVSEHEAGGSDELRSAGGDAAAGAVEVVGGVRVRDIDAVHRHVRAVRVHAVSAIPRDRAALEEGAVAKFHAGVVCGRYRHVVDRPARSAGPHLDAGECE